MTAQDEAASLEWDPNYVKPKSARVGLSFTQEIPLLEELLASSSTGEPSNELRSSSLASVEARLASLLQTATENEQAERIKKIQQLQEQFNQVFSRLQQHVKAPIEHLDVLLFRPHDVLRRSVGTTGGLRLSHAPADDGDIEEEYDDVWLAASNWLQTPLHDEDEAVSESSTSSDASSSSASSSSASSSSSSSSSASDCTVCWLPMEDSYSLKACAEKHLFCRGCWRHSFGVFISEAELAAGLSCLHKGCRALAEDAEIATIVDADVYERYLRFSVLAVVNANPATRWCPNPTCSACLTVNSDKPADNFTCTSCNTIFCITCSKPPHPGKSCGAVLTETEKQLAKWLASIGVRKAKKCPGCRELVEKNTGCNHMTCRCGTEWCWLCRTIFFAEEEHDRTYNSDAHFHGSGDSLCYRLHFSETDSLLEARSAQFGSTEAWIAWRKENGIETLKEWKERTAVEGFFSRGTPAAILEFYQGRHDY